MRLVFVEAIRGQCASFMILPATVADIFGGQTHSSSESQCWAVTGVSEEFFPFPKYGQNDIAY